MTITIDEIEQLHGRFAYPLPGEILEAGLDWKTLAQAFTEKNPLWYDRAGLWWTWSHTKLIYELIDETDLLNLIDSAVKKNSLRTSIKAEVLEAFRREARKKEPLEPPTTWVQFGKTITDLATGETIVPSSRYLMTNRIPHELGDNDNTPVTDKLLNEWAGDYAPLLKQVIAYCCLRDLPLHRIFLLIGSGRNGKDTYMRLISNLVGNENVASTELDFLLSSPFHVTKLHKKLVAQMSETNFTALKNTSILKRLTGGGLIGYEYKNKTPFDDYCFAKIIIATNSLPVTHDKTDGFYSRWVIVDFPNQFNEKKDVLAEIPETEYNNLATWCVKDLQRLLKEREFYKEGDIRERKERYEARSNPLTAFLETSYEKDINTMVSASEFYDELSQYLQEHGYRLLSYQTVRNMMKEEGYEYEKHQLFKDKYPVSCIIGIKRKSIDQFPAKPDFPALPVQPIREEGIQSAGKAGNTGNQTTLLEQFHTLFKGNYANKPAPISGIQLKIPKITDDILENWKKTGEIIESPPGWVMPL